MNKFNRRTFVQLSAGTLLSSASIKLKAALSSPRIIAGDGAVRVEGAHYIWQYRQADDRFTLFDSRQRVIVSGRHQPAVVIAPAGQPAQRTWIPGNALAPLIEANKIIFTYEGVNSGGRTSISWRFDEHGIWMEPVLYESTTEQDIVSLHYFSEMDEAKRLPSLHPSFLVVPGVISGSTVSPILHNGSDVNQNVWLGRGSSLPGFSQQWALPVHFFCGFSTAWPSPERNLYTERQSDTFTCGLADLPSGDFFLEMYQGKVSPWIDYRSDLWHHLAAGAHSGPVTLGATFLWTIAPDYRASIAAYYRGLFHAGIVRRKENSPHKTAVALTPQFCTWGAQRARDKVNDKLDEAFLTGIYGEMKASGMKAGLFSIDDKWEGAYGNLEHSVERLPHFEQFLDQLRADGMRIGVWAAVMRCETPSDLGLKLDQMLKRPDGTPFVAHGAGGSSYYILDFTQPEVARVLTEVIRRFMRRYKPDLFKFDFGYELPTVAAAAPQDKQWTGERLLWKGLEVVIQAMRAENPDIVVMYYNLSPHFLDFIDIHSPDDLWMDIGDYQIEANRRLYFSSLMGQLGVSTYGSSGYDWSSSPSIWFDSAAMGSIGSLNDFSGDEQGESATPELIAKYNGIANVLRSTMLFEVLPVDAVSIGPTSGAHARSWARFEDGQLTLLAWRPPIIGDEVLLNTAGPIDSRVKDAVQSVGPVIVSSRTGEAISRSKSLAIVSYSGGKLSLRRDEGQQAKVFSHYFQGAKTEATFSILGGRLEFDAKSHHTTGAPLEWIEVHIS